MSSARGLSIHIATVLFSFMAPQLVAMTQASAEWSLVDGNDKAKVYVDPATIKRNGKQVSVWVLDDLRTARTRGFRKYLSTRAQEEHDCLEERFRLLALEYFSGNMGSGEVLYKTSGESNWAPIPGGTLAQSVWRFLCGKRF